MIISRPPTSVNTRIQTCPKRETQRQTERWRHELATDTRSHVGQKAAQVSRLMSVYLLYYYICSM